MSIVQISFIVLSAITLGGALGMVSVQSVFRAALLMVLCFVGVAGLYVLLEAGFLAAVQILIYVGAISVLILFAIMLTQRVMGQKGMPRYNEQWWIASLVAFLLFVALSFVIGTMIWPVAEAEPLADQIPALGEQFLTTYVLPFEVASVLLLMALVGAIIIARE